MLVADQLDALNVTEDRIKMSGPDESEARVKLESHWEFNNDVRDVIYSSDDYCMDGDHFQKADLFDDYTEYNDASQFLKDMQADRYQDMQRIQIDGTNIDLTSRLIGDFDTAVWNRVVETFGKARLWDELIKAMFYDTDTMMERLGYHYVEED